jgi:hypothetical protein
MFRRALATLFFVGGLFVLSADAQDNEKKKAIGKGLFGDPEQMFNKMDADNDKKVTKDEFKKFFEELTKGKLEGKGLGGGEKLFDQLDADSDGKLTLEEFKKLSELREKFKGKFDLEKLKALKDKK